MNSINYLMGGPIIRAQRFTPWQQPRRNWAMVAAAAVSVAGSMLASSMSESPGGLKPKVLPKTVSNSQMQDFDVLYDQNAIANMYEMGDSLATIAQEDRAWFEDVYRPMQDKIIEVNQAILPTIEKTSSEALEDITRSLVSGEAISQVMENKAVQGLSPETRNAISDFQKQLKDLPTESERIGQALVNVESSFSEAGKQLSKDYQSRGQTVSQASKRDLMMEKAKAKAGAAGLASEASRAERLNAAEKGAGLALNAETAEATIQASAAGVVGQFAGLAQSGAQVAKDAMLDAGEIVSGLETREQLGQLSSTLGTIQYGTRTKQDLIEHTQKNIKEAPMTSGAGTGVGGTTVGGVPNVAGSSQLYSAGGGSYVQGEPAYDAGGNLIDPSQIGAGGQYSAGGQAGGAAPGGMVRTAGGMYAPKGGAFDKTYQDSRQMASGIKVGKTIGHYNSRFHVEDSGKIVNLQTGEYLNPNVKSGKTKYDNQKLIDRLLEAAKKSKKPSGVTTEMRGSLTERKPSRRPDGDGGFGNSW